MRFAISLVLLVLLASCSPASSGPDAGESRDAGDTDAGHTRGAAAVLATGLDCPLDLAVDPTEVFAVMHAASWNEQVPGELLRVPKDGSGATVFAGNQFLATRLAVDATHVYWTQIGTVRNGAVKRQAKDGTTVEFFAPSRSQTMDVQVNATDVYWAGYEVARQGKAATTATVLGSSDLGSDALAIDATHAYFSIGDDVSIIARVPLAGGAQTKVVAGMMDSQNRVYLQADVIEVDATHVYWTSDRGSGLKRALKDGTGAVEVVVPNLGHTRFALDDANVYWAEENGAVKATAKNGSGTPVTLFQGDPMTGTIGRLPIAVDDTHVYWGFCGGIRSALKP